MKEYWIHGNGNIIETERNPCKCCPDSYDMTRTRFNNPRFIKTVHMGVYPRRKLFSIMRNLGFEKLAQ